MKLKLSEKQKNVIIKMREGEIDKSNVDFSIIDSLEREGLIEERGAQNFLRACGIGGLLGLSPVPIEFSLTKKGREVKVE